MITPVFATTRFVVVLLVAALAPIVAPAPAFVVLAGAVGLVLVAAAADVIRAPDPGSLVLDRQVPEVVTMRSAAELTLTVRNPHGRGLDIAVHDASPPSLHREPRRHRGHVPEHGRVRLAARIEPSRRGRHPLGPVTIRTSGPLGLAGRQRSVRLSGSVRVHPPLPGRAAVELRLHRARLLQSGQRSSRVRGGGTEFDTLREYHRDDQFRHINWHATARANKPITNLYREERNQQVVVALDTGRTMAGTVAPASDLRSGQSRRTASGEHRPDDDDARPAGGVPRLELAIDATMAVTELAGRIGDHVGMMAFARDVHTLVPPRTGRAQAARILDAVFALQPTLDAPDYRGAVARLLAVHRRRKLLVLLTELTDVSAMQGLLGALPTLVGRHLVLVGAVRDPGTVATSTATPTSSDQLYRKAAAGEALGRREEAAARLRGLGAQVVDTGPDRLAAALADRYLRIKATGRL